MSTAETLYCYHCARHHPREEMRQIDNKGRKKWRCLKSIEATRQNVAQRNAFGQTVTAVNRSEAQARIRARESSPEQV